MNFGKAWFIGVKIYFIRHGETEWNKAKRLQGQSDIPLNDYGRRLAYETREGMKGIDFQAVFTSPLVRAKETAQILMDGRDIPIWEDERIKEISFGIDEGASIPELKEHPETRLYHFLCNPEGYIPPEGGESLPQLAGRCGRFVEEKLLPMEKSCENVLVVAHGALIRAMICHIEKIPFREFWNGSPHPNCAVTIFECNHGKVRLLEEGKTYYNL